ncbi:L,D-transpeptidase family protein [Hymenobacter sp. BT683]|uniref:L,D-transpeptidase family protein n=1 Tax=Hymenobacter jeongseonensis TaxID=2791027 RepID=A0ABS0IFC8_9BACT|nr:L,D-transpeptidase family protein [Hymenobacter jeongseonensis]MBF9236877.1 L,D-transpeptidase family protein [Hymenobacter jeongseonensis]
MRLLFYLLLAWGLAATSTNSTQARALLLANEQAQNTLTVVPPAALSNIQRLLLDTVASAGLRSLQWYNQRATRAFYTQRHYAPAWSAGQQLNEAGEVALALLRKAEDYGLQADNYHMPALQALTKALAQPADSARARAQSARLDVLLTDGLLRFVLHLRRGQLRELTPSPLEEADSAFVPAAWVANALAGPDFAAELLRCQPQQREYQELQQALVRWRKRPTKPQDSVRIRRAQQLALTLERWRWQAIPDTNYVLVNLPAYALEVVERDSVLQTHRLVIGKPESPTPTLSSRLKVFTLTPEWRVPYSIATEEILPKLRDNPRYAARHNYSIYNAKGELIDPKKVDWWDVRKKKFNYTIRQNPGPGNALGSVIFRFRNPYEVFLHATYDTRDFKRPYRALGHGCMRMENPMSLVSYLMRDDSVQTKLPTEAELAAAPVPRRITLERAMPLHVRYATCAVVAGQLRFYADVYNKDEELRQQLFGSLKAF